MWAVFSVLGIFIMALMSPGPDFSLVVKNSLVKGRKEGCITALGTATGVAIHITYCILGLGLLIGGESPLIRWIRVVGGLYLIYIGVKSFISPSLATETNETTVMTKRSWYYQGLLTNLLNANAALFFISIYSSLVEKNAVWLVCLVGLSMVLITFFWFCLVSFVFSFHLISRHFVQHSNLINRMLGTLLIAFGIRILFL